MVRARLVVQHSSAAAFNKSYGNLVDVAMVLSTIDVFVENLSTSSNSRWAIGLCLLAAVCPGSVVCAQVAQAQDVEQSQDEQISKSPASCERPGFGWPITGLVVSTYGGMALGSGLIFSTAFEESTRSTRTRIDVGATLLVGGIVGVALSATAIRKRRQGRRAIDARCRAIAPTPSYLTRIRLPSEPRSIGREQSVRTGAGQTLLQLPQDLPYSDGSFGLSG